MKVAFLDRDGVINKEVGYLHKKEDFKYTYKCVDALQTIKSLGYEIVIITNQAGIGKGIFTRKQYDDLTSFIQRDLCNHGIRLLDIVFCPHVKGAKLADYDVDCFFRKPNPGMIKYIFEKYLASPEDAILIGDKVSDVRAGLAAGIDDVYLVRSGHKLKDEDAKSFKTFLNLYECSNYLCGRL